MNTPQDKEGGPAFPRVEPSITGEPRFVAFGLSVRDYFAAKAMQALMADGVLSDYVPSEAYKIADAMLAAREA